ncbi:CHRD domain-containing protein [Hyalangium rubrum]|uniref:CHRD domain-containing protein n=1 Tax=Hyalangium rubrum TaxID=3103134 RepID=A0ABU5H8J0_9BACT|nr:CHRD domain-containing protein [Hyalangium sp. s54d21]MDY7229793.1 CHRD domain-containing protein [Hyalangium sp. s54d21]
MKANRLFIACVSTLALVACGGGTELTGTLSGAAQKPTAVTTSASGSVTVKVDGESLDVDGDFTGLSGNAASAHIHGPVGSDGTGPIFCHLKVPAATSGSIGAEAEGSVTPKCSDVKLTDTDVTNFEGGKMYVNIHTNMNPNGEIRADLTKKD